ncbi:2-hydroxyacid dehydrogenase [Pseudochelatococcus sp. B33]
MRVVIATDGFLEPEYTPKMKHDIAFVPHDDIEALAAALARSDALVSRRVNAPAEFLKRIANVRLVQQVGVGTDRIDLMAASALGISVANTPDAPNNAVVEHTFLIILAALRGFSDQVNAMRTGGWSGAEVWEGEEIGGKTVGILGFGSIGSDLARRLVAFKAETIVHTRTVPAEAPAGIAFVDLPTLLRRSDILVVAAGLNPSTRGLLGPAELAMMKPGALFVNIARGAIVDEPALIEALGTGRLRGALDAFAREPVPADSPLRRMAGVVVTPHSAGASRQSRDRIWAQMRDNLDRLADGRELINVINRRDLRQPQR